MNQDPQSSIYLPFFTPQPTSGLTCPVDSYSEVALNIGDYLEAQSPSTFLVRVTGKSMVNAGILDQSLLVVNRDIRPSHQDIVIAEINGELSCKILDTHAQVLRTANTNHRPVSVREHGQLVILGVVTHAINPMSA
jgi:DNA polymerase V